MPQNAKQESAPKPKPERKIKVKMSCNWYSNERLYKAGDIVLVTESLAKKMEKLNVIE